MADDPVQIELKNRAADFVRLAMSMASSGSGPLGACAEFEKRWPRSRSLDLVRRSAVQPGMLEEGNWGSTLAPIQPLASGFVALLRNATVIGRLTGARRAPLRVKIPRQTSGASIGWVGEFRPIKVGALNFDSLSLDAYKLAGIVVISNELARSSDPAAVEIIRADMIASIAQMLDESFLDPSLAEVPGVSPASITYGTPEIQSSGTTAAAAVADLRALFGALSNEIRFPALVMSRTTAISLASLDGGAPTFPAFGVNGGSIWGVPIVVSASSPNDANSPSNRTIVLIDQGDLLIADTGEIEIDVAKNAAVNMDTAPDSPATAATVMLDFWSHDCTGIRAIRPLNWKMARTGSVAMLTGVQY